MMDKPRIVIADEDLYYVIPLQLRFVEEMFDQIQLEIITDRLYFETFFQEPQEIEILIVSESLYRDDLQRHPINHGFIMSESIDSIDTQAENNRFKRIYKYTNIKDVFSAIHSAMQGFSASTVGIKGDPKIILVTSALGGVGKTTISMGIAAALSNHMKKVLYINVDYLQTFQCLLSNQTPINDNSFYLELSGDVSLAYSKMRHLIRKEDFYYIPPFKRAMLSLGIPHSIGIDIAKQAQVSKEYDFVIVDSDSSFDQDKIDLISTADQIVFVTTQTEVSAFALNRLMKNLNLPDSEKITIVCNQFDQNMENALISSENEHEFFVSNYVKTMENYWDMRLTKFSNSSEIQKIALMLL